MENLGQYILSVVIAAMICTIAVSLIPSPQGKAWIRLLCGFILTVTVIRPLASFRFTQLDIIDPDIWSAGESFCDLGEEQARDSFVSIIKQECESYILDKANALGACIRAEVLLSEDTIPVPAAVTLYGEVSPYLRLQLEAMIQEDMGITKENLRWMD